MLNFHVLFLYTMSILFFLSFGSSLAIWMAAEINLVVFILLMCSMEESFRMNNLYYSCLFYFIIQTLGSILFLISSSMNMMNFFLISETLLILSFILKLGASPFHGWIFKFTPYLSVPIFIILLTFHKIPFMLLIFKTESYLVFPILMFNLILGCLMIFYSFNLEQVLISSSIYINLWFYYIFSSGVTLFILFYFLYCLYNVLLYNESSVYKFSSNKFSLLSIIFFLFLMGIPPFSLFFIKFFSLYGMLKDFSLLLVSVLWLFSFLSLIFYFFRLYPFSMKMQNIYMNKSNNMLKTMMISLSSFFYLFLFYSS